ncbi:tetratricopeptide repeat protein [Marichromatium sp. AB32]|uniref:tetratricopeptide repeat protein n=1 Tax=Marichromatium sp. AB32 TaxID=2483363 RepID=UPI000F3E95E0|nr:tetratricopeptide repeat protein [Marichromatium sp. AB32]RNE94238.1 sel1 repeat family protein [Marichromatium sp. AB32]
MDWLHDLLARDVLRGLGEWSDHAIRWIATFFDQQSKPLATLSAVITVLMAVATVLSWLRRRLAVARGAEARLLLSTPTDSATLNRYSARAVTVLGRDREWGELLRFLKAESAFCWLQLAGSGGQGKSRLALELIDQAQGKGWVAGFLDVEDIRRFGDGWTKWWPDRPHLIVIDYIIGREAEIKPVLQGLARRARLIRRRRRGRVRVLLLERQRWDRGGIGGARHAVGGADSAPAIAGEARAEWFIRLAEHHDGSDAVLMESRFERGVIELCKLDQAALVEIVRAVARQAAPAPEPMLPDAALIAEQLARIDGEGRPLYAYFLGQMLADGGKNTGWQRDDLLAATLNREQGARWRRCLGEGDLPCLGDGSGAERMAVLATITGGLDCVDAVRRGLLSPLSSTLRRQVLVLVDGCLDQCATGPSHQIPPVLPDLLGEWFVLSAFDKGVAPEELMDRAWRLAPRATAGFLQRIVQDFPEHPVTALLLELAPPEPPAWEALVEAASTILAHLHRARRPFPEQMTRALIAAAETGDGRAMSNLGVCYHTGQGLPVNLHEAVRWYRRAAEAGVGRAMTNLGLCHERGDGVVADPAEAVRWYRRGAEVGHGRAMVHLGVHYSTGQGVPQSVEEAVRWYLQGARAGDGRAMALLGICYQGGQGVARDIDVALDWFRRGAEAGDCGAMVSLGVCYHTGQGVPLDLRMAECWYRRGAEAGSEVARQRLGLIQSETDTARPEVAALGVEDIRTSQPSFTYIQA